VLQTAAPAPIYVVGTPQVSGVATPYAVGTPPAYASVNPYAATAAASSLPGRLVIQGAAAQTPSATGQCQPAAADVENLEAKFRQLQEREQRLLDRIDELQRYIQQRSEPQGSTVPPCPPAPMPQPACGAQREAASTPVIQQSVYREAVPSPADSVPIVERLPRVE
jgi:hypothetical protein